jgi:tetratricopeptide (TPR) repeat protein
MPSSTSAARIRKAATPVAVETAATAFEAASALESVGRFNDAIVAYDTLAERFGGPGDSSVKRIVRRALFREAHLLKVAEREVEAGAVFARAKAIPFDGDVTEMLNHARDLYLDSHYEDAMHVLADLVAPWVDYVPDEVRAHAVSAYVLLGHVTVSSDPQRNNESARQCYELAVRLGRDSTDPDVLANVTLAHRCRSQL